MAALRGHREAFGEDLVDEPLLERENCLFGPRPEPAPRPGRRILADQLAPIADERAQIIEIRQADLIYAIRPGQRSACRSTTLEFGVEV